MFDTLFKPIKINNTIIKNRLVMAPMSTNLGKGDGHVSEEQIRYYEEKAQNGVGLIITEAMSVHPSGTHRVRKMSLMSDAYIPELRRLTNAVHAHGAAIFAQMNHQGRTVTYMPEGYSAIAPSAIPSRKTGLTPKEMTKEDIQVIQQAFADAARRAEQAGFDGVELHGGHGYLMTQFLSRRWNKRTDEYGGCLENRMRFPIETVLAIRRAVSSGFVVSYRLESDEYAENGVTIDEASELARKLQMCGVDAINVVGGNNEVPEEQFRSIATLYSPNCYFAAAAAKIRQQVSVPVMVAGKIRTPEEAEYILCSGKADMILLGRSLVADPFWVEKAKDGHPEEIHTCISCNAGCISRINEQKSISCVQNTLLGAGLTEMPKTKKPLNIAVIGAGISGLEFALRASQMGHKVTVFEKEAEPGGQVLLAAASPGKEVFEELIRWRYAECVQNGVLFQFKTQFDASEAFGYEKIVVAAGAEPIRFTVPGNGTIVDAWDVFSGKCESAAWKKVVIVGAGATGLELAHLTGDRGIETIVVEMTDRVGANVVPTVRAALQHELETLPVQIHVNAPIASFVDGVVSCKGAEPLSIEGVDAVITAVGVRSNQKTTDALAACGYPSENCICIGDANGRGDTLLDTAAALQAALLLS